MGLDQFIRKTSKRKAHSYGISYPPEEVGAPFMRIPDSVSVTHEIAYWRGHRPLNRWMIELARERVDPYRAALIDYEIMNGKPILLHAEDIVALQIEASFGTMFREHYDACMGYTNEWVERSIRSDLDALGRCLRIAKCDRSYLYYVASW